MKPRPPTLQCDAQCRPSAMHDVTTETNVWMSAAGPPAAPESPWELGLVQQNQLFPFINVKHSGVLGSPMTEDPSCLLLQ